MTTSSRTSDTAVPPELKLPRDAKYLRVAIRWIERHCVIPDGFRRGDPFLLSGWQKGCLANHYRVRPDAVWRPDDPMLATAFHYRRSQIVLPQKAGKGPFTAAQTCLEGVGPALFAGWAEPGDAWDCWRDGRCRCGWKMPYRPGEPMGMLWPTPLIQITAVSEEQTDNIYAALRPMIEHGPLADLIPRTGEEFIRLPGGGRIDTVTSSAQSRLGQRVTFVPQDEVGIWTDSNKMTKVAKTQRRGLAGMGGRSTETTNGWDPAENSVAQQTAESTAKDVFRYHPQAPKHLSYTNKAERRQIHRIVYAGSPWVDLDAIEAEAAELVETDPTNAERFFGNRIVAGLGAWIVGDLWDRTAAAVEVPDGVDVCLGFDGSDVDDWTAIRLETFDGHRFTPTYGPDSRPTIWNPAQWGGSIPRGEVHAAVDELARRYRIKLAFCDPRDWQSEIGEWALKYGDEVFLEWATYRITQMHDALDRSLTDYASGRSTHDACPLTATAAGNARKIAKPGDRYILGKPSQHQKIDPIMADVLAHEAAATAREDGWGREPTNLVYFV